MESCQKKLIIIIYYQSNLKVGKLLYVFIMLIVGIGIINYVLFFFPLYFTHSLMRKDIDYIFINLVFKRSLCAQLLSHVRLLWYHGL